MQIRNRYFPVLNQTKGRPGRCYLLFFVFLFPLGQRYTYTDVHNNFCLSFFKEQLLDTVVFTIVCKRQELSILFADFFVTCCQHKSGTYTFLSQCFHMCLRACMHVCEPVPACIVCFREEAAVAEFRFRFYRLSSTDLRQWSVWTVLFFVCAERTLCSEERENKQKCRWYVERRQNGIKCGVLGAGTDGMDIDCEEEMRK